MKHVMILLASLCILACEAPQEPTFLKLENVSFNSLVLKKPYSVTLKADAIFHNPNVLGAKITEMDFDVFINDKKTTQVRQDVTATMPANSDFTLPIECKIPLKEVFEDLKLKDLLSAKVLKYKMDGHLKIGLGNLEVKVPVTYEGEEKARM